MRIKSIKVADFRRFSDLEITDIPESARLVVLAGPNGCGKSSLFDAMAVRNQARSGHGWHNDPKYYNKLTNDNDPASRVSIETDAGENFDVRGAFYLRTAYRNDPEFRLSSLDRVGPIVDELRFRRLIESDAAVSVNFKRLVSQALEDLFKNAKPSTTIGDFREAIIGTIRDATKRLFPDLTLNSLGNPLEDGTFRFDKGASSAFSYMNLSGGEKAAFDLILDMAVRRETCDLLHR